MVDLISFVPPPAQSGANSATSAATLSGNFDTFLSILTAQIQNQDPLEPMDSSQFTEQLVQFSGVEQQIRVNSQLETLIANSHASTGAMLSGYLGQQVEIDSAGAAYTGEKITWKYELPQDAKSVTVTVTNAAGKVLYSRAGEKAAGSHTFEWNGELFDGKSATNGEPYWISVVAEDANSKALTPTHSLLATVTGVDLTYGEPALTTNAGVFAYADVKKLMRNASTSN